MHWTHVAYGGCWKCPQLWQRCSSRTPRLAASQNGFVLSFGTGIGRVTLLQSLIGGIILSPFSGGARRHLNGERLGEASGDRAKLFVNRTGETMAMPDRACWPVCG